MRRAREARLGAYHRFARQRGWQVLGLYEDLSYRYPVTPLLGAHSAQAELALTGRWHDCDALVASVLVLPGDAPTAARASTPSDVIVQLTMLDTGPDTRQFTATWTPSGPLVAPITPEAEAARPHLEDFLRHSAACGSLLVGDQLAATEVEILHARILDPLQHEVEVLAPLTVLAGLADSLA
jgi:hypothetical protein